MAFACGVPAFMLVKVLNAGFFSRQDTSTPARTAVIAMLANVIFNLLIVVAWVNSGYQGAHAGLALATSLSVWLNVAMLYWHSNRRHSFRINREAGRVWIQTTAASLLMGGVVVWLRPPAEEWMAWPPGQRLATLAGLIALGCVVYLLGLLLTGFNWRWIMSESKTDRSAGN